MLRLEGDSVTEVTMEQAAEIFRAFRAAIDAVNSLEPCTEKIVAAQEVFGRSGIAALVAADSLR